MKYKSIITATILGALLVATPGCQDEFSKENTNPSAVVKADVRFLFTEALSSFEPSKYQQWFYNNLAYTLPWVQATVMDGGNTSQLNMMGAYEGAQSQVIRVKLYTEEIKHTLSFMTPEEAAKYENITAMCKPLLVYMGIFGTDMVGSMAYSEASRGLHEEILTPKFDTQEELLDLWLSELNGAIAVLGANLSGQTALGTQDFVYKGNVSKWAKFANSLKLKIAVRLVHLNKAKALSIAQEVVNSPVGILTTVDDGFFYNKGVNERHFGDDVLDGQGKGLGSKQLIDFLVSHKDPRVRFIFQKNDFNSMVVQAFLNTDGAVLPPYIAEVADIQDGVFKGWKAPGEPWVRYYGGPVSTTARDNAAINDAYFNSSKFRLGSKQYQPLARMNREMLQGMKTYTFPDAPNVPVTEDNQQNPWFGLHFSAAEVHLYLAELSLLGATLPQTADAYLEAGIRLSVQEYNRLASLNRIPYYSSIYDPNEATIQLKDGELDNLLAQADYKLSGTTRDKLERVYIQQYIHFLLFPNEQFSQVRRSGVPMRGSSLLPWMDFTTAGDAGFAIPRRWVINVPTEDDLMYQIKKSAYEAQGFTTSTSDPKILNEQRVKYDQGAPQFGAGPNL